MIPKVQLRRSMLVTSRLAFGTSRLHYVDRSRRNELLAAAADFGIVHFDTAPAYGDGLGEHELGRFLHGQRSRFIVATKYGIPPDPILAALPSLSLPLRGVRAVARRLGFWQSTRPMLTAGGLRKSVEQSLRRLGTDWVDLLLLHEPTPQRLPAVPEMLEELVTLRQKGLIRHFGLAGSWSGIAALGGSAKEFTQVVQTSESEWPEQHPPDITYGAISVAPQSAFAAAVDTATAVQRLRSALARRPDGVVIVSTSKTDHLGALADIARVQPQ